jgi:integrase
MGRHIRAVRSEAAGRRTTKTCRERDVLIPEAVVHIDTEAMFGSYALEWLDQRIDLAERTRELYAWLLTRHVNPTFGSTPLRSIDTPAVRRWHVGIARTRPTTAAKAYRLLSSILRTAVTDGLLETNPCQIRGAAVERAPERPVATVVEVEQLAQLMPPDLRIAVVLAAWCQLRRGEVRGLRRKDIDLELGLVTVEVTRTTAMSGRTIVKEPKTRAGRRSVAIPANALELLVAHLGAHVGAEDDALIVAGTDRSLSVAWTAARAAIGRDDLRFHDLRHSGLTWSAATGASVAELMRRAGHASQAAALRYQHATDERDRAIARALAALATEP